MAKSNKTPVGRRGFLKGAAGAAAGGATALVTGTQSAKAQRQEDRSSAAGGAPAPTEQQLARDAGNVRPPAAARAVTRPGSDLMVQAIRDLGIEYVAANPGSTFEGIQESVINYGNPPNQMPEFITALHEESAVAMAHGYAKAEGKPMLALLHGTIGIQHAAMAIYNAYYDRVPILMIAGNDRGDIPSHTAADMAGMVRSFTKWDAQPKTLDEALLAINRAYNEAITPPMAPTLVVMDSELQKMNAPAAKLPTYKPPQFTTVDPSRTKEIAKGLVEAQNPRIAVGRLRTPEGVRRAVELAELVGASTSTAAANGPMSFPQRHPLCGPGADTSYDYTLGLETGGAQASIIGPDLPTIVAQRDSTNIGFGGLGGAGSAARERGGNNAAPIPADAEASLPGIIEQVKRQLTADKKARVQDRTAKNAAANQQAHVQAVTRAVDAKRAGWNGSPVSTARLYSELWPLIMNEDWCLSSPTFFSGGHNVQLWDHNKPYSCLGGQGAGGMGYGAPASVGAALAAKSRNRIVVNIQCDGDLNYAPGVLWTAAHHKLPLLTIMHNNRAWHQEFMYVVFMAGVRGRGTNRAHIGSTLREPYIDYVKMAAGYGMDGEGPISDPTKLAAALKRGVETVKRGEPYMIDVVTQPRQEDQVKRNSKRTSFIFAASLVVATVCAAGLSAQGRGGRAGVPTNNPPPTSPVSGDAASGKELFFAYSCYACHGYNGETGARPFVGNWGNLGTEETFIRFLRARANVAPEPKSTSMPNFAESTLSDKQAKDIYAYIRTFKSTAPDLKDIPTLNAIIDAASKPAKK